MSMFDNGFRVVEDKKRPILMIIDGSVVNELERDPKQKPPLKAGLYDLEWNYLGTEAEDGSVIPV